MLAGSSIPTPNSSKSRPTPGPAKSIRTRESSAGASAIIRLPDTPVLYFGVNPRRAREQGYAKWILLVLEWLQREGAVDAELLPCSTMLFNHYTARLPLWRSLYPLFTFANGVRRKHGSQDLILHVLYQTLSYAKMLEVSRKTQWKHQHVTNVLTVHDVFEATGDIATHIEEKLAFADALFVPSEFTRRTILNQFDYPGRIYVTYNPVDSAAFYRLPESLRSRLRLEFASQHHIPASSNLILFVGREQPRKNFEGLLQVLSLCVRRNLDVRMVLVSRPTGMRPALVKTTVDLGIRDRVIWIDHVTDEELARVYALADAYLSLSAFEGFGMPVAESMACGTPVVAADAAATAEVTGDAALLVKPRDYEGAADALSSIFASEATKANLARKGVARVSQFAPDAIASRYLDAYIELARNP